MGAGGVMFLNDTVVLVGGFSDIVDCSPYFHFCVTLRISHLIYLCVTYIFKPLKQTFMFDLFSFCTLSREYLKLPIQEGAVDNVLIKSNMLYLMKICVYHSANR